MEYLRPRTTRLSMLLLLATIFVISAFPSYTLTAQVSEAEAKQIFESIGCTSCHNGGVATEFDIMVEEMREWSEKYPTIDDAISTEVVYFGGKKFQSFDELMAQMAQNVGRTPDDPEIQKLSEFFKSFWQQGATPTEEQPQQEEQAPAEQQQEQPAAEQPTQEQPTGVRGGEEPREGILLTILSIAAIIIISAIAAVYLTRR